MTSSTGFQGQPYVLESHFGIKLDPSLATALRSANVNGSNANWLLPLITSETVCASTKTIKRNHMKLITSLIGITGISLVTLALAQETPPPAPEEKPSTTIQESPAPAPETTTATTPSEQTAAQKKEKTAAPAANQKPSPPAKARSSAAAAPSKKMSVEATLKDNENRWEASYAAHNSSVAESFVASDFSGVYWDGRVMGKSGVISEIKKDKDTYKSAVNERLAVSSYGPGVAVVIGTAHEKGTTKDGKPFDRTFRYTDTWVQRGGQWQCVASQVMKIKG
jgi:ketosteroid isomerase-like protein